MYSSIGLFAQGAGTPGVLPVCNAVLLPCRATGSTSENPSPEYWLEIIKVSPELIAVVTAVVVIYAYRKDVRGLIQRLTKFKGIGIEAEFSDKALSDAIAARGTPSVTEEQKKGALKRLQSIATLVRDARLLWVDDQPESTRNERALFDNLGARNTTVSTSAAALKELRENVYVAVVTDLKREGKDTAGLDFANTLAASGSIVPLIAYVGTPQDGKGRPPNLFAITNRPDELVQYLCDVIERARI